MTPGMNRSAVLGQCPRKSNCDYMFKVYMALSALGSFISACGGTPGYIVLLRLDTLKLLRLSTMLPCSIILIFFLAHVLILCVNSFCNTLAGHVASCVFFVLKC